MKCLNPVCRCKVYSRGLCYGCYRIARERILAGLTTWDKLVKKRKALAPHYGGPKRRSAKYQWFIRRTHG